MHGLICAKTTRMSALPFSVTTPYRMATMGYERRLEFVLHEVLRTTVNGNAMNTMQWMPVMWLAGWLAVLPCGVAVGQTPAPLVPSFEVAAARLQRTVVTLRVRNAVSDKHSTRTGSTVTNDELTKKTVPDEILPRNAMPRVTVCSGVLLGQGRVVAGVVMGTRHSIRVTLPGGAQAAARLRVIDEYSGLSLLEIDDRDLPGLPTATQMPIAGSWVASGAGWGTEKPVISFGIVSGTEIAVPQTTFPPLIRCDMRIAKTSSGAAVTNTAGELVGIVVLADRAREHGGWTYVVPVAHIERLIRTLKASDNTASVLVLKRRRPVVGMVLDGDGETVVVSRVQEHSPASKAGIQVGDTILATDNVKIRSVYQALRPVLRKQPGDSVTFLIERAGRQSSVPVVLGGGVLLPATRAGGTTMLVQPRIDVEGLPRGGLRARSTVGEVREFGTGPAKPKAPTAPDPATDQQRIKLLEKALARYQDVIAHLSKQLETSEAERKQSAMRLESLENQLRELKHAAHKN